MSPTTPRKLPGGKRTAFAVVILSGHILFALLGAAAALWAITQFDLPAPVSEQVSLVTASFEYESHQVIVVRGAEESTWGTWAAVACAVLLLGTLITLLSMPNWVRPQLLAIRAALRGHVQTTAPPSGTIAMAPASRPATQPSNRAPVVAATQPTTAPAEASVAATAHIKPASSTNPDHASDAAPPAC